MAASDEVYPHLWSDWLDKTNPTVEHNSASAPNGTKAVLLFGDYEGKRQVLISIYGELRSNGANLYFCLAPYYTHSPVIHTVFKKWDEEKCASILYACVAFHHDREKDPSIKLHSQQDVGIRYRSKNVAKRIKKDEKYVGFKKSPTFATLLEECRFRYLSISRQDVQESLERVRKEMNFLVEHVSEEQILEVWNEVSVKKILEK